MNELVSYEARSKVCRFGTDASNHMGICVRWFPDRSNFLRCLAILSQLFPEFSIYNQSIDV